MAGQRAPQVDGLRREIVRTPDEVAAMLRLRELGLGWGTRRIAAEFGCSRNTVTRYVGLGGWAPGLASGRPPFGLLLAGEAGPLEVQDRGRGHGSPLPALGGLLVVAMLSTLVSLCRRERAAMMPSAGPSEALCEAAEIASGRDAPAHLCSRAERRGARPARSGPARVGRVHRAPGADRAGERGRAPAADDRARAALRRADGPQRRPRLQRRRPRGPGRPARRGRGAPRRSWARPSGSGCGRSCTSRRAPSATPGAPGPSTSWRGRRTGKG